MGEDELWSRTLQACHRNLHLGQFCLYSADSFFHRVESLINPVELLIHCVKTFVHTSQHPCETGKHPTNDSHQQTSSGDDHRDHFKSHVHTFYCAQESFHMPANLRCPSLF